MVYILYPLNVIIFGVGKRTWPDWTTSVGYVAQIMNISYALPSPPASWFRAIACCRAQVDVLDDTGRRK